MQLIIAIIYGRFLTITSAIILHINKKHHLKNFLNSTQEQQYKIIKENFHQNFTKTKLENFKTNLIPKQKLKASKRIFTRLKICSQKKYQNHVDKLIISECKTPTNILSALFLLKQTNNHQKNIKVTPLAESKEDLKNFAHTLMLNSTSNLNKSHNF